MLLDFTLNDLLKDQNRDAQILAPSLHKIQSICEKHSTPRYYQYISIYIQHTKWIHVFLHCQCVELTCYPSMAHSTALAIQTTMPVTSAVSGRSRPRRATRYCSPSGDKLKKIRLERQLSPKQRKRNGNGQFSCCRNWAE